MRQNKNKRSVTIRYVTTKVSSKKERILLVDGKHTHDKTQMTDIYTSWMDGSLFGGVE